MKADLARQLDAEFEAAQELPPQQGRLARRPLGRLRAAGDGDDRAAARPRSNRHAEGDRRGADHACPRASSSTARSSASSKPGARRSRRRRHRLGDRRGAGLRHAAAEGHRVRLSGQDCGRGTFSQRHAVLIDQETESRYVPLNHIRDGQAPFEVIDSPALRGGGARLRIRLQLAEPHALVLWEAQFGDFANGAQVIIDQFISSGERKWLRMSGLRLLLPHGYEGQGPEHSSARLERFLQLCAEDNMQVCKLHRRRRIISTCCAARCARFPQAADHDDAEIAAAPQARGVAARRDGAGHLVPSRAMTTRRRCRARRSSSSPTTRSAASCCAAARSTTICYEAREKRGIDDIAICCASSSSIRSRSRR